MQPDKETVSALEALAKAGVVHVLLTHNGETWQASLRKKGDSGYTVFMDKSPSIALFGAMRQAGLTDGPSWAHPNPLARLEQAIVENIIARWSYGE